MQAIAEHVDRDSLGRWQTVYERISEFIREAGRVGEAIADGDADGARIGVHRTRAIRAALMRARHRAADQPVPMTPAGIELMARLKLAHQQHAAADRIVRAWIERELPPDEQLLQSEEGCLAMADRLLPAVWDVDVDLAIIVGTGGYLLAHALRCFGQERILVYVPEHEAVFAEQRELIDAELEHFPAGTMIVRDRRQLGETVMDFGQRLPERIVCHRTNRTLSDDDYVRMVGEVHQSLDVLFMDRNTLGVFGGLWLRQGLDNLPKVATVPSVASLHQSFEGVPMVIAAPGPSLTRNVHLLRELKGRALIVGFSHTLSALAAAGVVPDMVIALDMEDLRYHFDGFPVEEIEALALGLTVHPEVYELPARSVFSLATNGGLEDLCKPLGEDMRVSSGGSVAHAAFALGVKWGCSPIVLVGQDLSFPDGKVYCDTNVDGSTRVELSADGASMVVKDWSDGYARMDSIGGRREGSEEAVIRVPGYHGGEVVTSSSFALFRRWFQDAARYVQQTYPDRVLLNCTEGGAYIDGMEHVPLRDAIDRYLDRSYDIAERFARAAAIEPQPRQRRVLDHMRTVRASLATCRGHAAACHRLAGRVSRGRRDLLGKLERIEARLVESLHAVSFIGLHAQDEIFGSLLEGKDARTVEESMAQSRRLFDAVLRTCDDLEPRVEACIARLEALLAEGADA